MYIKNLLIVSLVCTSIFTFAQTARVEGNVSNDKNNEAIAFPSVILKGKSFFKSETDKEGNFIFKDIPYGNYYLVIQQEGYFEYSKYLDIRDTVINMGNISIEVIDLIKVNQDNIPTVSSNEDDGGASSSSAVVSSLLSASRDPFVSATGFQLSAARFRNRGYDNDDNVLLINGAILNNLEKGEASFSEISGLNDVLRARDNNYGLEPSTYSFGDIGNSSYIDAVAAKQRKGTRVSYALTNRSYRQRLMFTHNTGMNSKKWAFTISGSKRFAGEGYIPGTFYDSWALYGSISKKIGDNHLLSLTGYGMKTYRGTNGDATKEAYTLAGTNYYNDSWGWLNNEKRNSRNRKEFTPSAILTHDWQTSTKSTLITAFSFQSAVKSRGSIDWINALSPMPDYYKKMPSYILDPAQQLSARDYLINNPTEMQIDWNSLYEANYNHYDSVFNIDGNPNNSTAGKWSRYVQSDQVEKSQEYGLNSVYNNQVNNIVALTAGLSGQMSIVNAYKQLDDLLGGDFYVNVNQFRTGRSDDSLLSQNDANRPNQILHEGDIYGYNYKSNLKRVSSFLQSVFTFKKIDFFMAGKWTYIEMFREGVYRNGAFLNSSYGKSEVVEFRNYSGKAGITYKLNGKSYFFVNGMYETRAPYYSNVFVSTRTRNAIAKVPANMEVASVEGGYLLRDANWKGRLVGFYTLTMNETFTRSFFNSNNNQMGTLVVQGVDKRHMGIELAIEGKIYKGLKATLVASIGDYIYTNRPTMYFLNDNDGNDLPDITSYMKGLHVASGPQNAGTLGLQYSSPKYWRAGINANYFDKIYVDPSPYRRTVESVDLVPVGSEQYNNLLTQEHLHSAWTFDANFSKSFYLNRTYPSLKKKIYVDISANVNNILDYRDFVISGREQLRLDFVKNDPDKFPNKYTYMQGRTYFVSIALRM